MEEIWKDIKGYEGLYQVSNLGRIRKIVLQSVSKNGYKSFNLIKGNHKQVMKVHRAVAEAFIPNPNNKPQVNHIDGNKQNNNVSNLEWVTTSENMIHAIKSGLVPNKKIKEKRIRKTLDFQNTTIYQYDKNGKFIKEWKNIKEAVEYYHINLGNMSKCCKGKRKSAGGYIWKIKEQ